MAEKAEDASTAAPAASAGGTGDAATSSMAPGGNGDFGKGNGKGKDKGKGKGKGGGSDSDWWGQLNNMMWDTFGIGFQPYDNHENWGKGGYKGKGKKGKGKGKFGKSSMTPEQSAEIQKRKEELSEKLISGVKAGIRRAGGKLRLAQCGSIAEVTQLRKDYEKEMKDLSLSRFIKGLEEIFKVEADPKTEATAAYTVSLVDPNDGADLQDSEIPTVITKNMNMKDKWQHLRKLIIGAVKRRGGECEITNIGQEAPFQEAKKELKAIKLQDFIKKFPQNFELVANLEQDKTGAPKIILLSEDTESPPQGGWPSNETGHKGKGKGKGGRYGYDDRGHHSVKRPHDQISRNDHYSHHAAASSQQHHAHAEHAQAAQQHAQLNAAYHEAYQQAYQQAYSGYLTQQAVVPAAPAAAPAGYPAAYPGYPASAYAPQAAPAAYPAGYPPPAAPAAAPAAAAPAGYPPPAAGYPAPAGYPAGYPAAAPVAAYGAAAYPPPGAPPPQYAVPAGYR